MWPFKKKQEQTKEKVPSDWEKAEARVAVLRAWRDVGEEFYYLKHPMTVVKHSRTDFSGYRLFLIPEVHARYVDCHGEIRTLVLEEAEALALANKALALANKALALTSKGGAA